MKRIITILSVACMVTLFSAQVFAWGGHGWHGNGNGGYCGMGPGYAQGPGGGQGGPGMGIPAEPVVKSADEARTLVQKHISENFKGYKINDVQSFAVPRGTMYQVNTTDASGNKFYFHVNPWGNIMGPFVQ